VACYQLLLEQATEETMDGSTWQYWNNSGAICWLVAIHFFGGTAQVLDKSFLVAVERDWIVRLSTSSLVVSNPNTESETPVYRNDDQDNLERLDNQEKWLSETNVALKQIDLSCQIVAPVVSGWILNSIPNMGISWVGLVTTTALLVEWNCMSRIANLVPEVNEPNNRPENGEDEDMLENEESTPDSNPCAWISLTTYFRQPVSLPGVGLALLYFNVLTFAGMMTAYLVARGMSLSTIGLWRGIASTIGLLGTFAYHESTKHFSLRFTALWSIVWEFICLTITFASIFVLDDTTSLTLLIAGVLFSRIGLWVYDIAVTQLFQQSVPEEERGQVGGTQMSLNSWMELLPFGLAMIFHRPTQFYVMIVGGYLAVGLAMLLYSIDYVRTRRRYQRVMLQRMVSRCCQL